MLPVYTWSFTNMFWAVGVFRSDMLLNLNMVWPWLYYDIRQTVTIWIWVWCEVISWVLMISRSADDFITCYIVLTRPKKVHCWNSWLSISTMSCRCPGVMSRIERSYENCEIHDNSQDHWQSVCNLFKGLQGGPVQSYENCKNYEVYENCKIYDNSQDYWQNQRNLFKKLQGRPIQSYKNCEN